eukprot:448090_1
MRLRVFSISDVKALSKIMRDDLMLKHYFHYTRDFQEFCCQRTLTKEHFTSDNILINIAQWNVIDLKIGILKEVSFYQYATLSQVKRKISEYTGIDNSQILVVMLRRFWYNKIDEYKCK